MNPNQKSTKNRVRGWGRGGLGKMCFFTNVSRMVRLTYLVFVFTNSVM